RTYWIFSPSRALALHPNTMHKHFSFAVVIVVLEVWFFDDFDCSLVMTASELLLPVSLTRDCSDSLNGIFSDDTSLAIFRPVRKASLPKNFTPVCRTGKTRLNRSARKHPIPVPALIPRTGVYRADATTTTSVLNNLIVAHSHLSFVPRDAPGSLWRSRFELKIPWAATSSLQQAFAIYTAKLWNGLPLVPQSTSQLHEHRCTRALARLNSGHMHSHDMLCLLTSKLTRCGSEDKYNLIYCALTQIITSTPGRGRTVASEKRIRSNIKESVPGVIITSPTATSAATVAASAFDRCVKPYIARSATLPCCKRYFSALNISPGLESDGSRTKSGVAVASSRAKARSTAVDASRGLTEADSIVPASYQEASQVMAGDNEPSANEPSPQQMMSMLQRIDAKIDNLTGQVQSVESSITRLETRIEAQETRTEQHKAEITEIRAVMGEIQASLRSALDSGSLSSTTAPTHSRMTDSCEILLTGLPIGVNLSEEEVLATVFTVMGLKHFHKFLAHTRPWEPKSNRRSEPATTKAFVFTLSSPNMRDHCIKSASKLSSINVSTLFGMGNGKIKLRPLWPIEVFNLLNKAYEAAHKLNYAQPTIDLSDLPSVSAVAHCVQQAELLQNSLPAAENTDRSSDRELGVTSFNGIPVYQYYNNKVSLYTKSIIKGIPAYQHYINKVCLYTNTTFLRYLCIPTLY
ncbi:unnamed protein product, partial [Trichogramma brassicae]